MTKFLRHFAFVFLIAGLSVSCVMNNLGTAAQTAVKLGDDLYYMEVAGNDGFEEFLARGGAKNTDEVADFLNAFLGKGPFANNDVTIKPSTFGCSAFIAPDENGNFVVGRNFDWEKCHTLILRDSPSNGYASVSTCNLDFLGFGENFVPEGFMNKFKALAAIFVPLDGINEKGLVVADLMAGDNEVTNQNTEKADLTTTTAIRLLLNKAATVDQAVELLGAYDMHSDIGSSHHLFIADVSGKSVVAEWTGGVMYIVETNALTNHYLCMAKKGVGIPYSESRLETIQKTIQESKTMNKDSAAKLLNQVKAGNGIDFEGNATQWSVVYNVNAEKPEETFYWRSNFGAGMRFIVK